MSERYKTVLADQASDLAVGTAGEHMVMADLLLRGYRAILAEQHCPYDIVVDLGPRLVRIQVKSARRPTAETRRSGGKYTPAYMWSTRRAGKKGRRLYDLDGLDVLALVALDIQRIAYMSWAGQQHVQVPAPGTTPKPAGQGALRRAPRHDFDALTFETAVT